MSLDPGTKTMTAPGVVGTTRSATANDAYPVRVYFVSLIATAATAGTLHLYNGTSAAGTKVLRAHALANSSDTLDVGWGMLFTSGCYADFTTGSMHVAIQYTVEPA